MRKQAAFLTLGVAVLILLSLTLTAPTQKPSTPNPTPFKSSFKIKASIPYWVQDQAFTQAQKNAQSINILNLFWYFLTDNGNIQKYKDANEDLNIINFAHSQNIEVFAVLTNLPEDKGTSWDSKRVEKILQDKTSRQKHIQDILEKINLLSFDGILIDYEEVKSSQKNNFTEFIKELSQTLISHNKKVAVALHPKRENFIGLGAFQDWKKLAEVSDHLNIMAYGEHYDEGSPGPIASLPWVEQIVKYSQSLKIPPEKIYLGVPLYGYDWNKNNNEAAQGLNYSQVQELLKEHNLKDSFDDNTKSPYFTYEEDGDTHQVWFENGQSIKAKIDLAQSSNLAGITLWHLGDEDPKIWEKLK